MPILFLDDDVELLLYLLIVDYILEEFVEKDSVLFETARLAEHFPHIFNRVEALLIK